jgi:hypothetical protein
MAVADSTSPLTAERARECVTYDPSTGEFRWKSFKSGKAETDGRVKPGDIAGDIGNRGYRRVCIDYQRVTAHRLAFLVMTGAFPPRGTQVDHINGDRSDNRWVNLRLATSSTNQMNAKRRSDNASGARGVSFCKITRKWYAYINVNGKRKDLGRHLSREDAAAARKAAEAEHFGEFSRGI